MTRKRAQDTPQSHAPTGEGRRYPLDEIVASRGACTPFLAVGWDQSINHGAMLVLDEGGALVDLLYLADKARDAKRSKGGCALPGALKTGGDSAVRGVRRLFWLRRWFTSIARYLFRLARDREAEVYIAIEDYAYGAGYQAHQIGEVGGQLRIVLLTQGLRWRLRLYDPHTVKLFASGNGNATKDEVRDGVVAKWGVTFEKFGDHDCDLADAYALARVVWTEVHVRSGALELRDLAEPERRVFLRTTKARPVNLLDRPWVTR